MKTHSPISSRTQYGIVLTCAIVYPRRVLVCRLDSMSAALAVTDEVALPIRAVGDLAAAAEVSREEVAVITQCAALGELSWLRPRLALSPFFLLFLSLEATMASCQVRACGCRNPSMRAVLFAALLACFN